MNEEYIVIPRDEIKNVTFPFIEDNFVDGTPLAVKYTYIAAAYKYIIREDMFDDDLVTFDIVFYLGTHYFPRKTIGNKYSSTTLSILFTTKVKDKSILDNKIWEYIYSIERMDAEQLRKLNYKTFINTDLQSEEEIDVIEMFNTIYYVA